MRQCSATRRALRAFRVAGVLVLAGTLAGGCRTAPLPRAGVLESQRDARLALEAALDARPAPAGDTLRLALAFDARADLDLFVTGPFEETVYFANSPSAIGGRLDADLRCDAGSPRVESVTFPDAPPGRYRVGIDFPARCGGGDGPVVFVVSADRGRQGELAREAGAIRPGEFLTVFLEFDAPAGR